MQGAKRKVLLGLLVLGLGVIAWIKFRAREVVIIPQWTVTVLDEKGRPLPGFEVTERWMFYGAGDHQGDEAKMTDGGGQVVFPARVFHATSFSLSLSHALSFLNVHASFGPSGSVVILPRGYKSEHASYSSSGKVYDEPGASTTRANGELATTFRLLALDFFDFLSNRDWARVNRLIATEPDTVHLRDAQGATPLIRVMDSDPSDGRSEALQLLFAAGVPVNEQATDGTTALHVAARNYEVGALELLLSKGANPRLKVHDAHFYTTNGFTPVHFILSAGSLRNTAAPEKIKGIELLLAHGADIDAKDDTGATPLHLAAVWGDPQIVAVLLARGADPLAKNSAGQTPLASIAELKDTPDVHELRELLTQAAAKRSAAQP